MMRIYNLFRAAIAAGVLLNITGNADAAPPVFVEDGRLIVYEDNQARDLDLKPVSIEGIDHESRVLEYWGALDPDRFVVSIEGNETRDLAVAEDHHCSDHSPGYPAWIVRRDGSLGSILCTNVLRAYPAPTGNRVALISPERDLSIWHNDVCTTVSAPGKISNAGWAPDGRRLVVSVYPPDWSEGAVSYANTTADFLRLQNADLYLFDAETMEFVRQLTKDPGTEYGAFFSPDGRNLYYHWLHITEDKGGLMRMELDSDNGTAASAPPVQLTQAGNDSGKTPLGRVTTYLWRDNANQLVFEAGRPDGSGEIWTMADNGTSSTFIAPGRKPQALDDRAIVFMGSNGTPEVVTPEVKR